MKKWRAILIQAICLIVILVLFRVVFLFGYVPTASMEPTLHEGSLILGCRFYGKLEDGDIIIFEHDGELLVKRIAACPGGTIERDGEQLTVPVNCYYVLVDNAKNSYDSRYWENPFVDKEAIVAKLI